MTRVTTTPLAVSADYADALLAARRAKNWMFLFLVLFLIAQITVFFLVRFNVVKMGEGGESTVRAPTKVDVDVDADADVENPTTGEAPANADGSTTFDGSTTSDDSTTLPSLMALQVESTDSTTSTGDSATSTGDSTTSAGDSTTVAGDSTTSTGKAQFKVEFGSKNLTSTLLAWVTNSIVYLGMIFSIVMAVVVLLIVLIMLVGRLIGVSHSTSAFIWAVILAALLFPWQLCWGPETAMSGAGSSYLDAGPSAGGVDNDLNDFRLPGVLYTWRELRRDTEAFPGSVDQNAILKYARFVGFPVVALLVLFMVQAKSGRAVKFALGEAEVHVDVATTEM